MPKMHAEIRHKMWPFFISRLLYFDMFVFNSSWLAGVGWVCAGGVFIVSVVVIACLYLDLSEKKTVVEHVYIDVRLLLCTSVSFNLDQSNVCHEQKSVYKYAYNSLLI